MTDEESADVVDDLPELREPRRSLADVPRVVFIGIAIVAAVAIGLLVRGTSTDSSEVDGSDRPTSTYRDTAAGTSIADQLPLDPQYQQFLELASASGWLDKLTGDTDYTLFVPDAAAFAALPADDLAALKADPSGAGLRFVERHIIEGTSPFVQLVATGTGTVTAVDGSAIPVTVDGPTVTYDGATIVKHDINASNGVIHVLDGVGGDGAPSDVPDAPGT